MLANLEALRDALKENNHPALTIVQATLDKSNSAEFIVSAADMLLKAAKADRKAEVALLKSMTQSLKNND